MENRFYSIIFLLIGAYMYGQQNTGINTTTPDASAQLEVRSTNKGFLPPRIALLSAGDISTIPAPANGLLIYNTATAGTIPNNVDPGYYYWDGTSWKKLMTSGWDINGNRSTNPTVAAGGNFLGTIDDKALNFRVNNIHAGWMSTNNASTYLGIGSGQAGAESAAVINNVGIGYQVLNANLSGTNNTAIGYNALRFSTSGTNNTAMGYRALVSNTTGVANTAIGSSALVANTVGTNNTAVGINAAAATTGGYNTAVGSDALPVNTVGEFNTALGNSALWRLNASSSANAQSNTAIGQGAIGIMTSGSNNVALGFSAGWDVPSGNNNIFIGSKVSNFVGQIDNCIMIGGENVNPIAATTALDQLNIGNVIYGLGINALKFQRNGRIGINIDSPTTALHVMPKTIGTTDPLRVEGLRNGTTADKLVVTDATGVFRAVDQNVVAIEPWHINSTTSKATSNTDNIYQMGKVGIGTTDMLGGTTQPGTLLAVNGSIETTINIYSDYVFEDYIDGESSLNPKYSFKSLKEVEAFIYENKHLPGVKGIKELAKNEKGEYIFNITELSGQLLEKVEELYLHTIEQQKQIDAKDKKIEEMNKRLERLEKLIESKKD